MQEIKLMDAFIYSFNDNKWTEVHVYSIDESNNWFDACIDSIETSNNWNYDTVS
jgi:hypothetical protein